MTLTPVTGIGVIASEYGDNCHIVLPPFFLGKRVLVILKESWDARERQQERNTTQMVGTFATAFLGERNNGR